MSWIFSFALAPKEATCEARGCIWDANAFNATSNTTSCYVPKFKGGYSLRNESVINDSSEVLYTVDRFGTDRTANNSAFSLFNNNIERLNVRLTVSGTNMLRIKITGKRNGQKSFRA